ncbi:sialidase family protein [Compostibacter hankyongensis]|uniref:exo-alpha-sialidase n=1 Tax=Compostibacter hankyongensis TaxID=1007089 RepID=A0ABP8G5I6_9BACT
MMKNYLVALLFMVACCSCDKILPELLGRLPHHGNEDADTVETNLARTATLSTVHPALFNTRFVKNAADGDGGTDADSAWAPNLAPVNAGSPALMALSWNRMVSVDSIVIKWYKNWYFTQYTFATWTDPQPLKLAAPPPPFPHTDVYTGGEDGYFAYRIPALLVSGQGTVLAFCEARKDDAGDNGNIDLVLKRSFDDGVTWQPQQLLYGDGDNATIGNPVPVLDRNTGDIFIIFCRNAQQVFYMKSTDDGVTFSAPVDITASVTALCSNAGFNWNRVLTGPGHGLQTASGRLIIPLKPSGPLQDGATRRVGVIYSDDHGVTWKPGGIVPPSIGEMSESTAFETADSTLVLNMRWHDGLYRAVSKSADGGLSWSDPVADTALPDPVNQGSIIRYSGNPSDRRVLFSNLNHQVTGTANRNRLTVKLSNDDGASWTKSRLIVPGPSGYSDLAVTHSGKCLVFFERGTEIYSEKLTLARIDMNEFNQADPPEGTDRYDVKLAKEYPSDPAWHEQLRVTGNTQTGSRTHVFSSPLHTKSLLLYVDGVHQTGSMVYLQEIEVWGK